MLPSSQALASKLEIFQKTSHGVPRGTFKDITVPIGGVIELFIPASREQFNNQKRSCQARGQSHHQVLQEATQKVLDLLWKGKSLPLGLGVS